MKKLIIIFAAVVCFTSCKKKEHLPTPLPPVKNTFRQDTLKIDTTINMSGSFTFKGKLQPGDTVLVYVQSGLDVADNSQGVGLHYSSYVLLPLARAITTVNNQVSYEKIAAYMASDGSITVSFTDPLGAPKTGLLNLRFVFLKRVSSDAILLFSLIDFGDYRLATDTFSLNFVPDGNKYLTQNFTGLTGQVNKDDVILVYMVKGNRRILLPALEIIVFGTIESYLFAEVADNGNIRINCYPHPGTLKDPINATTTYHFQYLIIRSPSNKI
jgi:hypothetical protein